MWNIRWLLVLSGLCGALALLPVAAATNSSGAAQITLLDGTVLTGSLGLAEGKLLLGSPAGPTQPLKLDDIRHLRVGLEPAVAAPTWQGTNIGRATVPGASQFKDGQWIVEATGEGILHGYDSCYFIHQPLDRSGEVVAYLRDWQDVPVTGKAGVMLRESLHPGARNFYLAILPSGRLMFQMRNKSSNNAQLLAQKTEMKLPLWLKLAREGGTFIAAYSTDGRKWEYLSQFPMSLPDKLEAGFAFATGNTQKLARVTVELPRLKQNSPVVFKPRLRLVSGTELPAAIFFADDTVLKAVWNQEKEFTVPRRQVARIIYQPLTPDLEAAMRLGRVGLLLLGGDFVDGELRSLAPDSVTISSVVFGLKTFKLGVQPAVLVMREGDAKPPRLEIHLKDGTLLRAQAASLKGDRLLVTEPILGELAVPLGELREFHRGP